MRSQASHRKHGSRGPPPTVGACTRSSIQRQASLGTRASARHSLEQYESDASRLKGAMGSPPSAPKAALAWRLNASFRDSTWRASREPESAARDTASASYAENETRDDGKIALPVAQSIISRRSNMASRQLTRHSLLDVLLPGGTAASPRACHARSGSADLSRPPFSAPQLLASTHCDQPESLAEMSS
ncbi:hypothetical protein L1887_57279 [Cichorium endivia]|nr:hypothetical protein L1887_57279 [Cichorium endivia]